MLVGKFEVRIGDQFVEDAEQFTHIGSDGDLERFSPLHEELKKVLRIGLNRTMRNEAM